MRRQRGRRLGREPRQLGDRLGGAAITTASIVSAASNASSDHATIGRPASSTSAFGVPAPRRSPEPAAARSAVASAEDPRPG